MTDLLRAQAVFAHRSGLPRDSVSMNFWFAPIAGTTQARAEEVAARVRDFFMAPVAPRARGVFQYFAKTIAAAGHQIKVYDYVMETGERDSFPDAPPLTTLVFDDGGMIRDVSEPLPSEVACCLSFRSDSGSVPGGGAFNVPIARRRGRVYFGPIGQQESDDQQGFNISRPGPALTDYLLSAAEVMIADDGDATPWVVYSRPFAGRPETPRPGRTTLPALPARQGQAYVIDNAWVDNAWDTQRRRGEAATARTFI